MFDFFRGHHIAEPVVLDHAVGASDNKLRFFLCLFSHFSNAESANIILATATNKDGIEVTETNWAAIFEFICAVRIIRFYAFDILFAFVSLYSYFVAGSHFF